MAADAGNDFKVDRRAGLHQAHDFSDAFYLHHGLDPAVVIHRHAPNGEPNPGTAVYDPIDHPNRNDIRILPVNCGYDAAGSPLCYPDPPGELGEDGFLDNEAGAHAREVGDSFRAFIFPKAGGNPLSPAPPNRRQDNLFDTSKGYLTHNPLGLWRLTFVHYTDAALNTPEGQARLEGLRTLNGTDLDGTPIIRHLHMLLELEEEGYVVLTERSDDGGDGSPWVV